jgi:hypothetical protein
MPWRCVIISSYTLRLFASCGNEGPFCYMSSSRGLLCSLVSRGDNIVMWRSLVCFKHLFYIPLPSMFPGSPALCLAYLSELYLKIPITEITGLHGSKISTTIVISKATVSATMHHLLQGSLQAQDSYIYFLCFIEYHVKCKSKRKFCRKCRTKFPGVQLPQRSITQNLHKQIMITSWQTWNQNIIVKHEHKKSWMISELYLNSCLTILQTPCTVNRNIMRNLEDHSKCIQIYISTAEQRTSGT